MNYFEKKREKKLAEQLDLLKKQEPPIAIKLNKTIFYPEEAHAVISYYVRLAQIFMKDESISERLKLAAGFGKEGNRYFWLFVYDMRYFAVEIGRNSKIYIGHIAYLPYAEVASGSDVDIFIKDCGWQLRENAELYARFLYKDNRFEIKSLFLKGVDIRMREINDALDCYELAGVWNLGVECGDYRDEVFKGICGKEYDVWVGSSCWNCFSVAYCEQDTREIFGLWRHEKWWKGEKVIRRFLPNERPQIKSLIIIWDRYRKNA